MEISGDCLKSLALYKWASCRAEMWTTAVWHRSPCTLARPPYSALLLHPGKPKGSYPTGQAGMSCVTVATETAVDCP